MSAFSLPQIVRPIPMISIWRKRAGERRPCSAVFRIAAKLPTYLVGMLYRQLIQIPYLVADRKYKGRLAAPAYPLIDEAFNIALPIGCFLSWF